MKQSYKVGAVIAAVVAAGAIAGIAIYSRNASAKSPQLPPTDSPELLAKEAAACATTLATKPAMDGEYGGRPQNLSDLDWYTQVAYHKVYPNNPLPPSGPPSNEFPADRARYIRIQACIAVGLGQQPPPPVIEPPSIGTVERPGYTITPNCGGVTVWLMSAAMEYARVVAQKLGTQYGTYQGALEKADADYFGGCPWETIRDRAPLFWYRMRVGFFRGMVDTGLIKDSEAQIQINNMRAFPPFGLDPSMMTPTDLWGMVE